ncbi:oligosaccharide flippase family protein [Coprobacter tertius]|uniref:Oligosaccharide flippase family protein n=1 Tax=Coprobacter tertius TaxID=2944915 RepID=A0ABT1MJL8_9BACT|nr:oligosaccharide flippase family protein [Coprobacter tertius]MCP9612827.1 oligosaccharide flippase family protein [Coprobacter tertius]
MNFYKASLFNLLASGFLSLINMIIGIIEARILGPEELGRFQLFISTQTIVVTIFSFGIGQASIYFINKLKMPIEELLTTSIKCIIPLAILSSSALFVLMHYWTEYWGEIYTPLLLLFTLGTFSTLFVLAMRPILLAKLQIKKNQFIQYISSFFLLIAISLVFYNYKSISVDILLALIGVANFVAACILFYFFRKIFNINKKINFVLFKRLVVLGIKLSGNNIAMILLTSTPLYFISWMINKESVGYFSRATSILVMATFICTSIGPLLYAKWTMVSEFEMRILVKKAAGVFMLINLGVGAIIFFFAPSIVNLLYGEAYTETIPLVRILSLSLVFIGVKEINYNILVSLGKAHLIFKNLMISFVLLIILLFLFIPFGLKGSVWSVVISTIITTFMLSLDSKKVSIIKIKDFFYLMNYSEMMMMLNKIIK